MALRHRHFVGQQEQLWLFPGVSEARGSSQCPLVSSVLTAVTSCFTRVQACIQEAQGEAVFTWLMFTNVSKLFTAGQDDSTTLRKPARSP